MQQAKLLMFGKFYKCLKKSRIVIQFQSPVGMRMCLNRATFRIMSFKSSF